jgi:hypothetical protein
VAVQLVLPFIVILPVEQAVALQPLKMDPGAGVAVKETTVPLL